MKTKESTPRTFPCDCHDRGHIIIARHFSNPFKDFPDEELYLDFQLMYGDWFAERNYGKYDIITNIKNFFRRKLWRIKTAFRILFKGFIEVEDSWSPLATNKDKGFVGIETTQEFIDWLQNTVNIVKENIEKWEQNNKHE